MRRWPSVTARHIDFLFNREETVVTAHSCVSFNPNCYRCDLNLDEVGIVPEGDWQLPPSDESKVGQD